ncbi:hypothetical protein EXT68_22180 [Pectobacterium parmentieri]|uniref:hypothetical protein n=1 Tax=Pectobacterium parmentieri TaxID=1905730 RepID=UPI00202DB011|nr:hypothetical protein [Pectobacterium parmentieri]MCL6358132.1 hypothetical protein [Pectobacterium parmentieri]MCL6382780.1 hypothetical protein [Pectobacterium parmentieri]
MKKIFNRKRVDNLTHSVSLGHSCVGHSCLARLDKLALVIDLHSRRQNKKLVKRLFGLQSGSSYMVKCRPAGSEECGGLYRSVVEIRLANKVADHPLMLVIHFAPTGKDRGVVRMELSPQRYAAAEITDLFIWLGRKGRLGKYLYKGLRGAWVTTIHYALDVIELKLHDYLISLSKVHDGKFNDLHGEQEGLRLGSTTLVLSAYEKANAAEERFATEQVELDEHQFEGFLRLELRLSPGKRKLMLGKLSQLDNLVSRLAFYDRKLLQDCRLDPDFVRRLEHMPVPKARATFSPADTLKGRAVSPSKKAAKKRVDKVMKEYRVELFDANTVWSHLPQVLEKLGILDQPQYWEFKQRLKWLESRKK